MVASVPRIAGVASAGSQAPAPQPTAASRGPFGPAFRDAIRAAESRGPFGGDLHREIVSLQHRITGKSSVSFGEMLVFQLKVGQLNLRTELLAKIAESLSATLKKFQNGQ